MTDTSTSTNSSTENLNPNATQYLLIALAGNQFGVRLNTLQEVLRFNPDSLAPIPNSVHWLEGIISLRGTITSIVNLRAFLGLPRTSEQVGYEKYGLDFGIGRPVPRVLVTFSGGLAVGLIVDDIKGMLFVQPQSVRPLLNRKYGPLTPYILGEHLDPETQQLTALLDLQRLINTPAMLQLK
jgi:purine-binding chemotaxis protein CheW